MLNNEYHIAHLWCAFCFLVQSVFCFCKLRVRTYRRRFLTNTLQSRRNTRYPPITWGMSQLRKMQPSESDRGRRMMRNMERTCIMLKMEWTNLESDHAKLWVIPSSSFHFFCIIDPWKWTVRNGNIKKFTQWAPSLFDLRTQVCYFLTFQFVCTSNTSNFSLGTCFLTSSTCSW